ncbi:hypothetical protein BTO15_15945 [Polaribacter sejongensis]|uniref:Uncharacterized protein n=1 Tax=Polaribacter sejongensis TaxID=985043 RepID=A0ABM6Q2W4_9FLAO|nr:type VI secretion system tube protein TssD [Polaribacter sejongensis]AUC23499.1 hypothetical protein BTO15_15945 [Polaribacter sejongensis]
MKELNVIQRIELRIKKDDNTEKVFKLSQCDYNLSSTYYPNDEEERGLDVNLSGVVTNEIDTFFLEWLSRKPGEWSGSLKIYHQKQDKPVINFVFDNAIIHNYNQSFSENNVQSQDTYINTILSGVVFNDVKMN